MMELKITVSLPHNCFISHLYCGLFKLCFLLAKAKNKIPNWLPSARHACFCLYSCYLISMPLTNQRDAALSNKSILIVIQCPNYLLCSDIFCCVDRSYIVIQNYYLKYIFLLFQRIHCCVCLMCVEDLYNLFDRSAWHFFFLVLFIATNVVIKLCIIDSPDQTRVTQHPIFLLWHTSIIFIDAFSKQ